MERTMTAFVAPLAITIRMEVMRRKKIMTSRAGWMLVFMISVLLGVSLVSSRILAGPQEALIPIVTEPRP